MRRPCASKLVLIWALGVAGCAQTGGMQAPLGLSSPAVLPYKSPGTPPPWAGQAFSEGVVAVANPHAAEAGAQILESGGNAIDAAVAIAYALNVVEPQSAGIGGGGFMMIHLARSGRTFAIDSRETAPAAATPALFGSSPGFAVASLSGAAVGVPGMVRGTAHALEHYGQLPLATVLQPAIQLADDGFAATARYAAVSCNARARNSAEAAAFFCPGGSAPAVGSRVRNQPLAETFRLLAAHGADCFYRDMPDKGCDIAKGIIEGQKSSGPPGGHAGAMDYADLEAYRTAERAPNAGVYRGHPIQLMSPPSSGGLTVLQMLKMLERFPIGDAAQGFGFGALNTVNLMTDAMRVAFADRAVWMADADFAPVPQKGLLATAYVGLRGAALVPGTRTPDPQAGDPRPYEHAGLQAGERLAVAAALDGWENGTTHFSVVDRHGNMVAYTNTIESSHGIGVFAGYRRGDGSFRNHGFLLNNELTDFNLAPSVNPFTGGPGFNDMQPGKRPRSSMSPAMIFSTDGRPLAAFGSPGGATIINSVLNVTLNLIDHRMSLQDAVDAPRVSAASPGGPVTLERDFPQSLVDAMAGLGYTQINRADVGSVQAVLVDPKTGKQYGAADARRDGTVIGLPRRPGPPR